LTGGKRIDILKNLLIERTGGGRMQNLEHVLSFLKGDEEDEDLYDDDLGDEDDDIDEEDEDDYYDDEDFDDDDEEYEDEDEFDDKDLEKDES
jgi:hypothetical protein